MNKFLLLLLCLLPVLGFSQTYQYIGTKSNIVKARGGLMPDSAIYIPIYDNVSDTSSFTHYDRLGKMFFAKDVSKIYIRDTITGTRIWRSLAIDFVVGNGLSQSGDSIQLGQLEGDINNPAILTNNREIPVDTNYITLRNISSKGGLRIGSGSTTNSRFEIKGYGERSSGQGNTPFITLGEADNNQLYVFGRFRDTISSNNLSNKMGRALQMSRDMMMDSSQYVNYITGIGGSLLPFNLYVSDSIFVDPLGNDLAYGLSGAFTIRKRSDYTGRSVVVGGDLNPDAWDAIEGQLGQITVQSSNMRLRGSYASNVGLLAIFPANDTMDQWIGHFSNGYIASLSSRVKRGVFFAGNLNGFQQYDTLYNMHFLQPQAGTYHQGVFGIGIDPMRNPGEKLQVIGTVRITDTLKLPNIIEQTDTTGQHVMVTDVNGNVSDLGYSVPRMITNTATLDFASTAAGSSTDLTITVTGAVDGDVVMIGVPNGSTTSNGIFSAWVSANDTVTVRFSNNNLVAAADPASGTFRATVIK